MRLWIKPLVVLICVIVAWQILVPAMEVPKWLLPTPADIALRFGEDYQTILWGALKTLSVVLAGFGISVIVGVLLGIAIAEWEPLREALYPLLTISQVVPQIAIAPLLVIWFGSGDFPKIIIAFLISFFPMVVNTFTGLTHIEEDLLNLIRGLGASRFQTLAMIRFPNALPYVFAGMKVSIALAVIGAVVGEFVGSKYGLGYLVIIGTAHGETDLTFGSLMMLGVMGVVLFNAVRIAENLLVPWHVER